MVAGWRNALLARWPRLIEIALTALVLVQSVRFFWALVTPVGPVGEWKGREAAIPVAEARAALFRSFDPFYPPASGAATGAQNVTSLSLSLFGLRLNEGSGQGAAILANGDGEQNSYAVGDEIIPGVRLKAVLFDHVIIDHGGVEEALYIDQSKPAETATPGAQRGGPAGGAGAGSASSASSAPAAGGDALTVEALKAGIGFSPRLSGGRVTGLVVTSKGDAFQTAGFRPGDVVTQINGRPISSAQDLAGLQRELAPGARISLMVERGAQLVPIAIMVGNK